MRIVIFYAKETSAQRWRDAIAAELAEAQVDIWKPGTPAQEADYAVGWTPPSELFVEHPRLRAFFSTGAGVEHVLHNPALPKDLPIVRIEDAGMGTHMVDYCRFEVLRWMLRRDEYASAQAAGRWEPRSAQAPDEWPIGVFGFGALGRHVAAAFAADGFPVNGYSKSAAQNQISLNDLRAELPASERNEHLYQHVGGTRSGTSDSRAQTDGTPSIRLFSEALGRDQLAAFLQATRVLVILAPLTADTQDRFDHETLRLLPPNSYVINVARGGLIVDEALLALLDSGHIAGAALDVFRKEPLPSEHRYWSHPKVRITPHVAATTPVGPASKQIAEKIRRLMRGESVTGVVDRQRGY